MTDELKIAIEQLERQRAAIEKALVVLREIDGPAPPTIKRAYKKRRGNEASAPAPVKRTMSEAGRKAVSEATKKRWAAKRAAAKKAAKTQ
jgi:hypothetical protein